MYVGTYWEQENPIHPFPLPPSLFLSSEKTHLGPKGSQVGERKKPMMTY
jgi:hypothetical protein